MGMFWPRRLSPRPCRAAWMRLHAVPRERTDSRRNVRRMNRPRMNLSERGMAGARLRLSGKLRAVSAETCSCRRFFSNLSERSLVNVRLRLPSSELPRRKLNVPSAKAAHASELCSGLSERGIVDAPMRLSSESARRKRHDHIAENTHCVSEVHSTRMNVIQVFSVCFCARQVNCTIGSSTPHRRKSVSCGRPSRQSKRNQRGTFRAAPIRSSARPANDPRQKPMQRRAIGVEPTSHERA